MGAKTGSQRYTLRLNWGDRCKAFPDKQRVAGALFAMEMAADARSEPGPQGACFTLLELLER